MDLHYSIVDGFAELNDNSAKRKDNEANQQILLLDYVEQQPVMAAAAVSAFAKISMARELEQFHKFFAFNDDTFARKVNLTVGAYRDANGNPFVFDVVREAERRILQEDCDGNGDDNNNADGFSRNFGPFGYEPFIQASLELLLGPDSVVINEQRALGVQCLSGTGALRLGAEFVHQVMGMHTVFLPEPTWKGHNTIFSSSGFNIRFYRYYDSNKRQLDFDGMLQDLNDAEQNSVILLQACAHNPCGLDLSREQWMAVANVMKQRKLLPFFDIAYPGFVSGDPELDAWAIRYFADHQQMEMCCAQTFAKNFGLYNERVGTLAMVFSRAATNSMIANVRSQLEPIIYSHWANPPLFGARIVHIVLTDAQLRAEWLNTVKEMAHRLRFARKILRECLEEELGVPDGSMAHITEQAGFFCFTGLTVAQVEFLQANFHVYMLSDGRINVCGLNEHNVRYVANAFARSIQQTCK